MTEHSLSVTLKAGTGYDSPWVVVYGNDPSEVEFKLDNITGVLQKATSAAAAFRTLQTLEAGGVNVVGATQTQSQPAQQQWQSSPPAEQPAWSQAPQQQAAPQQNQSKFGGPPHPEGKQCETCGKVLELKKTSTGKQKFQCPDWRWNNGNPNGHSQEWVN